MEGSSESEGTMDMRSAMSWNKFRKNSRSKFENVSTKEIPWAGDRHGSVFSSAPNILRPRVRIPSTPSMLFSIFIIEIVTRKERK